MPETTVPTVLCIGGLDPSSGAGVAADIRACAAFGALALPVATAIVVQNTRGVVSTHPESAEVIAAQIETLLADIRPGAIKIGMLPNVAAIRTVARLLKPWHGQIPTVMDTVFAPSTGAAFNDEDAIEVMANELLPLASIVTPNSIEALQLGAGQIADLTSMRFAATAVLKKTKAGSVLLKGGHIADIDFAVDFAVDLYFDGVNFFELKAPRELGYEVRGTGCLLASAIAAQMAGDMTSHDAIRGAKDWLTRQYVEARVIGSGRRVAAI